MYRESLAVCVIATVSAFISGYTSLDLPQTNSTASTITPQETPYIDHPPADSAQSGPRYSSGDDIQVWWPNGSIDCSVSYISMTTGLTAGHCGEEGAEVFSHGNKIGTISTNYLLNGLGLDIAEIALLPSVGDQIRPLQVEEHPQESVVFANDHEGQKKSGELISEQYSCQRFLLNGQPVFAYVQSSSLRLSPGESGAPIYSSSGRLVALGQGGNGANVSTVTPISLLDSAKSGDVDTVHKRAGGLCRR